MIESPTAFRGTEPSSSTATGLGQLGTDAFLKLLVAQLKYQNPMAPSDGTARLQQTAQFTTVETLKEISEANQRLGAVGHDHLAPIGEDDDRRWRRLDRGDRIDVEKDRQPRGGRDGNHRRAPPCATVHIPMVELTGFLSVARTTS